MIYIRINPKHISVKVIIMQARLQKDKVVDPNAKASSEDGIFGLPFNEKESVVVFLPIPWDVTTSYLAGTSKGPEAILDSSPQIDFFDLDFLDAYKLGLYLRPIDPWIKKTNTAYRKLAKKVIDHDSTKEISQVNKASEELNLKIYKEVKALLAKNKIAILVGGDHSTPFGSIKAYAEKYPGMGVLHIDAHSDTRNAYMGFTHSHASIMRNISEKISNVSKIVQVGIRDFCEEEYTYTKNSKKFSVYFDQVISKRKMEGTTFKKIADEIIKDLPKQVYISFDIDGLDPRFCPHTGTPVPGGLDYSEVIYLIVALANSGKKIVGFDLVEVGPDEWDGNVGMRLLYKMTGACLHSLGLLK
jgi:agmatinase